MDKMFSHNRARVIKYRILRWVGHVVRKEEDKTAFNISKDKPTGKRLPGRRLLRWEDHIKMYLKGISVS